MRQTFLLQRFLEAGLVLEVVGLPDVLDDLRELLIAERVARLPTALDQQQLVDGGQDEVRSDLRDRPLQLERLPADAFASSGRLRSSATCRASNSVLVMISPFTLTSTCSTISARSGIVAARAASDAATIDCFNITIP